MREPTLVELDKVRAEGFRPGVVLCLINNQRLLMAYQVEYGLWQIPQGGVMAGEGLAGALVRVVEEELGEEMATAVNLRFEVIGVDRVAFPPEKTKKQTLMMETGEEVAMKGKHYFLVAAQSLQTQVEMRQCQYGVVRWVDHGEAKRLVSEIYQRGKRRMTEAAVDKLKESGFIV